MSLGWYKFSQRKFVEDERVFQAGHIIKCGKNIQNSNSDVISFTALCLQTSSLKENPHEINGKVTSGKILFCTCSCKAGLGEKCKHIIATLLYCYQKGEALETLSCTDKQCGWKFTKKLLIITMQLHFYNMNAFYNLKKNNEKCYN